MSLSQETINALTIALTSQASANELMSILNPLSGSGNSSRSVTDNIIANAGGGQTSATVLTSDFNRVTTVATADDSVLLPPARPGLEICVLNDGPNPVRVFAAGADAINGAAAAGTRVYPSMNGVIYYSVFRSTGLGHWTGESLNTPRPPGPSSTTISTVGNGTITAAAIILGPIIRSGPTGPFSDALDSVANIVAAWPLVRAGDTGAFSIENRTAYAQTITAPSGITLTGNTVIPPNSIQLFRLTFTSLTAIAVVGLTPTLFNATSGPSAGIRIASGVHQQAAASDTIATGLTTVTAVLVSWRDTPTANQTFVTATVGNQTGAPAAGSFIGKTFKSTYDAADTFTDNLSYYWLAIGT